MVHKQHGDGDVPSGTKPSFLCPSGSASVPNVRSPSAHLWVHLACQELVSDQIFLGQDGLQGILRGGAEGGVSAAKLQVQ